jgi:hypothetical protein
MPWQEIRPVDQKKEFVREYRRGLYTMTELAERYAISQATRSCEGSRSSAWRAYSRRAGARTRRPIARRTTWRRC